MTAQELRIGNWYIDVFGNYCQPGTIQTVHTITKQGVNNWQDMGASGECKFKDMQPIKLTEEWLVKFGLQLNRWFRGSYKITKDDEFGFEMHVTSANFKHQVSFAYFKHVHQLQNLYFALTGIEL